MQYEPAAASEGMEKKRSNQEYEKYYIIEDRTTGQTFA
jgi:hypothetical protein